MLRGKVIPWRHDYLIEYLGKNKLRYGRAAALRRDPDAPLPLRPVPLPRLAGALRPATDPWELRNVVSDPAYASRLVDLRRELARLYAAPPHRASN